MSGINRKGVLSGGADEFGNEYRIIQPYEGYYAVFKKVSQGMSGELFFWQQISKPYFYRGYAQKLLVKLIRGEQHE